MNKKLCASYDHPLGVLGAYIVLECDSEKEVDSWFINNYQVPLHQITPTLIIEERDCLHKVFKVKDLFLHIYAFYGCVFLVLEMDRRVAKIVLEKLQNIILGNDK